MKYLDFKKKYPAGSSVASPEGTYRGECVSYVRQKMALVDGVATGAIGNAADIPFNGTFKKYYEEIPANKRKAGDLMFWGDDDGNWTGKAGHTAIYDGGNYMMNQNYLNSRTVSRNAIFSAGFIGYYRVKSKGGTMLTTKAQLDRLYDAVFHTARKKGEGEDVYLNKDTGWVFDDLMKSDRRKKLVKREADELAKLKKAAASAPSAGADPYAKENNALLKQIWAKISGIFK